MSGHLRPCDVCDWTGQPTKTQALADYAYRRHSCTRQRRKTAAKLRRIRRRAKIDRTPKPCLHKQADHQHGTHACYVLDHCRCRPCSRANSTYETGRTKQIAYGRSNLTDATPIRDHVAALTASGVGLKTIAKRSGVAHGALWKLMYGKKRADGTVTPSRRIRNDTATRLLALRVGDLSLYADDACIDGTGTRRRAQALGYLGWSVQRIAEHAGIDRQVIDHALHGQKVYARNARAVAATYDLLWNKPPQPTSRHDRVAVSRTRNTALRNGWAPPLAWDDIDEPAATPAHQLRDETRGIDHAAVQRAIDGDKVKLTRAERWTVITRLHARGWNDQQIMRRTGISDRQLLRDRQALGLPAVTAETGDYSGCVA